MKKWFEQRKPLIIALGIVYLLLALFLVPGYIRNSVDYVEAHQTKSTSGDTIVTKSGDEALDGNVKTISYNDPRGGMVILVDFVNSDKATDIFGNLGSAFSHWDLYSNALKTFSIIYWGLGLALLLYIKTKKDTEGIEHGSAGWADDKESYKVLSKTDGFILAYKYHMPMLPNPPPGKNGNILVIGGSGAGKSASFAIPNALQMLGSYIFTDPKGELYDRTAGIFKKNGYHIHVINLADPKFSDSYNPLAHVREGNTMDVDIITQIISKKDDKGGGKGGDPFWDQTSEALLRAMIYYIIYNRPPEERSLASCSAFVRYGAENEGEDLMNIFKSLPFNNPAREAFDSVKLGSEKTFANILVSLAAKLAAFNSEDIKALTSSNSIIFEDLCKEKSVVYFITPESHGTYDFIMNIFFSQMFQRLYEFGDENGGALPIPMFLILDEFANIGRIPNFERILSTCRSKRLHISIILQSLDQIEEIYDEKVAGVIMANCSTQLFLGSNAQKTLETFSKLLGEATISHDSVSRSTDKGDATSGHSYSDQIMARALMTPDELRRLDTNDCIIFVQSMKPIRAKKYWYYRKPGGPHPLAAEAKACEISHLTLGIQSRGDFVISDPTTWGKNSSNNSYDDLFGGSSRSNSSTSGSSYGGNNGGFVGNSSSKNELASNFSSNPSDDELFGELFGESDTTSAKPQNNQSNNLSTGLNNNSSANTNNAFKQQSNQQSEDDLQAALEKRFDELFGPPKKGKKSTFND